jgi:NAD(P)-dependent dehydrogenase (short-subunit alcohol dehydrogenase family)
MAGNVPQLDGVVHSAGVQRYFPLKFIPEEASREMMALNYEAPIFLIQSLLKNRRLSDSASIVFISSLAGLLGVRGNSIYSGTKAALIASARVMALELATRRIRVNCIAPGIVKTPMAQKMTTAISTEQMTEHEKLYPLGFGFPEDVANAAVFLLSSASRWITGQTLVLDGGFSCH